MHQVLFGKRGVGEAGLSIVIVAHICDEVVRQRAVNQLAACFVLLEERPGYDVVMVQAAAAWAVAVLECEVAELAG